jgi:hypothetical protein
MQKIKIIVDGDSPSKNQIFAKQDFTKVLKKYNQLYKPAVFKNPWFFGIVGLSSLLIIILVN